MASLPEGSPPKLVMSVLPQLRDQNEQIIRMLREQNALLREHLHTGQSQRSDTHATTSSRPGNWKRACWTRRANVRLSGTYPAV